MKAVQKWGDGKDGMGLRDVPEPNVESDEVLIEVACVGICGSDLHIWKDEKEHRRPVTLGHEFSGVIIAKGSNVSSQWQIGDRIVASNESMSGRIGTTVNGAYAERMTVPEACVHRMPDNLSFEEGALVELVTAMSYSAMYRTPLKPADFVVVCGPGPVGLIMLQIVRLFSPRAIMVTGTKSDAFRLHKAQDLGADYICYSEDDPIRRVQELTNSAGGMWSSTLRGARAGLPRQLAWCASAGGSRS
jgi:L-iditol 2-dehydrogenase